MRLDPRNPRTHSKKQIEQIARSIEAFQFVNPILADEGGDVIAGHGRLLAAKRLGIERLPVITLSHLTHDQKRALGLADNRIAQNSGWDADLLRAALEDLVLPEVSSDLSTLGFSSAEIDAFLCEAGDGSDLDEAAAKSAAPRTKPGDIWILGAHRIGCGDARDQVFVRRVMGSDCVADMVFTDPPFNLSIAGHATRRSAHPEFAMASGEMTAQQYVSFLETSLATAIDVSRDGAVHMVCTDWRHIGELLAIGRKLYGAILNLCVWNKSNAGLGSLYRSQHELVPVFRVGRSKHFNAIQLGRHGRHRTNVWNYPSVTSPRGNRHEDLELHPTTKPVAMVVDAIKDVTQRGDVVQDLFLGAGSTLIAAERTGRRCRGVEIEPAYVDVAIERWTAMTGLEPMRHCQQRIARRGVAQS